MKLFAGLLASAAAVAVMTSTAFAADLYVPQQPFIPESPALGWTGGYVGAHVGYGFGDADVPGDDVFDEELSGWLAGVQAGYNHNLGGVVLGVEGDVAWASITNSYDDLPVPFDDESIETELGWLATLRGRVGFAADAFLVYGTAGVAFAGVSVGLTDDGVIEESDSNTHYGWVAGVGAEAMVTDNISLKAEYLYHSFGEETYTIDGFGADEGSFNVSTVKVGLNFHF